MTKEELLEILRQDTGDTERDHSESDDALLKYIDDPDVTEAFNTREKWYA